MEKEEIMDKYNQFICANTLEVELDEIAHDHIVPVHSKDNESAISHLQFVDTVSSVAKECFGEGDAPLIRVSHPIKGRIPEARNKPAKELLPTETTLYYERMAWMVNFPQITTNVGSDTLELAIGGVKAFNLDNLYSTKDTLEHFKVFIGFKNMVCTNLCVATDGFKADMKLNSLEYMAELVREMFQSFSIDRMTENFQAMNNTSVDESQFAQLLGRVKLLNAMPKDLSRDIPDIGLSDSQLSSVAEDYYQDQSHCRGEDGMISIWNMYNLFTGANKSSYIDTFLDRNVKVFEGATHLKRALANGEESWYLN
jgi:Domain of unknown function, B. Theta Gene description (DUF3871)